MTLSFRKDPIFFFLIVIFALAIFFRFYDYFDRVYIHSDHSLFAQGAIFSARTFAIPQIGPFAQSTFFTGPWWLWILGIFYLFPFGVFSPWYFISIISLGFVFLIYMIGREITGRWLGVVAALLSAISVAAIDNSLSLWNAAADSILAALAIYFLIKFYKTKNALFVFGLAFAVSLATTIHFQAALLLPLILVALVTTKPKLKYFAATFVGLAIPMLPFLIFDLRFNWFWTKSVWIYLTVDQYRFWVPNRWLTYAFDYWPSTWGYILGNEKWIGALMIGLVSILTIFRLKEIKKQKIFYLLALSFFLSIVMYRYYGGQRFFYFSNFAQPAVFLLTAWVIVELVKIQKFAGLILGGLVILLSFKSALATLSPRDYTVGEINNLKNEIYGNYPNVDIDVYGCGSSGALVSHPLALVMYADSKNSLGGQKIGVCVGSDKSITWMPLGDSDVKREDNFWLNHSTENIYRSMTEWWKTNPPK